MPEDRHVTSDDLDPTLATATQLLEELHHPVTPDALALLERLLREPELVLVVNRATSALFTDGSFQPPEVDEPLRARMGELYREPLERLHYELKVPFDESLLGNHVAIGPQHRRLLSVLAARVGQPVPLLQLLLANELRPETSRRVRELRREFGYFPITTTGAGDSVAYTLIDTAPQIDACAQWWLIKNIKDSGLTVKERLLILLASRLGEPIPLEDLMKVNPRRSGKRARGAPRTAQLDTARRVRELREDGWQVYSGPDHAGSDESHYVLETLERLPAYERIKSKVRKEVFSRAKHRCEECGWGPEDGRNRGKKYIEAHHKNPQESRPDDVHSPDNLECLCNTCHDARHGTARGSPASFAPAPEGDGG